MYLSRFGGKNNQSGQALLLLVLSIGFVIALVMSVSTRSIRDVSISTYEEDALRAFSAAEAGIERSLLTNQAYTNEKVESQSNSPTFTSAIAPLAQQDYFISPSELLPGESATFWFVGHDNLGRPSCATGCFTGANISNLCWGSNTYSNDSEKPAVVLSVYYDDSVPSPRYLSGDFSNVKVKTVAFDPVERSVDNNFDTTKVRYGCNVGGKNFAFYVRNINFNSDLQIPPSCSISTPGCLIMARVAVFYSNPSKPERVALDARGIPPQGEKIESVGVAGDSVRKIEVFRSFPEIPAIFDSAVFSKSDFVK
jgi:hypothetical protein